MCASRFFLLPRRRGTACALDEHRLGRRRGPSASSLPSSSRHGLSSISYIPSSTTSRVLSSASLSPFVVAYGGSSRASASGRDSSDPNQSFSARTALALSSSSYVPSAPSCVSRSSASASASRRKRARRAEGWARASADAAPRVHLSRLRARLARSVRARARNDGAGEGAPTRGASRALARGGGDARGRAHASRLGVRRAFCRMNEIHPPNQPSRRHSAARARARDGFARGRRYCRVARERASTRRGATARSSEAR